MDGHSAMHYAHTIPALAVRANELMKHNIRTLLKGRRLLQRDLAQYCRRSDAWIGKILKEERREFPLKYWDRIADFFGISVYQLIQPGISALTERRRTERRSGQDRRLQNVARVVRESALSDKFLIHEVLSLREDEDRLALVEQLALLKRRRIDVPSRAIGPSDSLSTEEPNETTQSWKKTRGHRAGGRSKAAI
jgi:hypothetical protein